MAIRPNCLKCMHYYVTHDPVSPYGCRAMGFKSPKNPALMVYLSSGIECQVFRAKKPRGGENTPVGSSRGGVVA